MLYLAKTKKGELERIQVIRDPKQLGIWGALNHDGTKVLVPFSKSNVNYECVLNTLIEKYETLTLSKRKVDTSYLHIICFNNQYYLYDDNGFCVKKFGKTRITFSNPGCGEITEHHTEEIVKLKETAESLGLNGTSESLNECISLSEKLISEFARALEAMKG